MKLIHPKDFNLTLFFMTIVIVVCLNLNKSFDKNNSA